MPQSAEHQPERDATTTLVERAELLERLQNLDAQCGGGLEPLVPYAVERLAGKRLSAAGVVNGLRFAVIFDMIPGRPDLASASPETQATVLPVFELLFPDIIRAVVDDGAVRAAALARLAQ